MVLRATRGLPLHINLHVSVQRYTSNIAKIQFNTLSEKFVTKFLKNINNKK